MGYLAEQFREAYKRNEELNQVKLPKVSEDSKGYLKQVEMKNYYDNKVNLFRLSLKKVKFSINQLENVYKKVLGNDGAKKSMDYFKSIDFYNNELHSHISNDRRALYEALSNDDKKNYRRNESKRKEIIDKWIEEGKITQDEIEELKYQKLFKRRHTFGDNVEDEVKFIEALEDELSDNEKQEIQKKIDDYKFIDDIKLEDVSSNPYVDEIKNLNDNIPENIKADKEKTALYEHYLDFAKKSLKDLNKDVREVYKKREAIIQKMVIKNEKEMSEGEFRNYKDGKYDNLTEFIKPIKSCSQVKDGREKDYEDLLNEKTGFSDKTKEGIRKVIKKMEDMGLDKYPFSPSGEDSYKIYGFNKLLSKKTDFKNAIKEGDPEKIMKTGAKYEKAWLDTEEIFKIIKEHFNTDNELCPGNLDSIRHENIPFEFTTDVKTSAQMNSLFGLFINIKINGLDLETYLDNPVKATLDCYEKKMNIASISEATKGKSLDKQLDFLCGVGDDANKCMESSSYVMLLSRQTGVPGLLEADEKIRNTNRYFGKKIYDTAIADLYIQGTHKKNNFLGGKTDSDLEVRTRLQTVKNLIIAKDEDRNVNAMVAMTKETDYLGRKIGDGFDYEAYMAKKPVDYDGIIERAKITEQTFKKINDQNKEKWASLKTANIAAAELYNEILFMHADEIDSPGYKRMVTEMEVAYQKVINTSFGDEKELYQAKKAAAMEAVNEKVNENLFENNPVQLLKKLEKEAIDSKDCGEFARKLVEIELRKDKYSDEVKEEYKNYVENLAAKDEHRNYTRPRYFYEELVKEMSLISNENAIIYAYERDDFAKKIRRGEIETDAVFDDLKKDYKVSIHLADDMLVDNRHVLLNSIGTAFRSQIVMQADLDERIIEESEKYAKKALTNVKVGRDANEREMFLKTITEDVPLSWSNDCGIKESKNVYTVTDEKSASNYLEKRADKYGKYVKLFSDFNELAKNTFEELKSEKIGGRSGSEEFKAFYDAVEKVQKINYSNDVYDIKKSYKELEEAAKAYKDKIDDQFFKKGSGKGRGRYSAAKTMLKEVRQYITDMDKLSDREFEVGYSLEEIFSNAAKAKKDIYTKKAVKLLDEAEREYLEQKAQKEAENNLKNAENKADNKHQKNADINVEKDDADNRRRKMSKKEVKEFLGNVKDKKEKLSSKQKNPPKTTVKETQPALGGKKKK